MLFPLRVTTSNKLLKSFVAFAGVGDKAPSPSGVGCSKVLGALHKRRPACPRVRRGPFHLSCLGMVSVACGVQWLSIQNCGDRVERMIGGPVRGPDVLSVQHVVSQDHPTTLL